LSLNNTGVKTKVISFEKSPFHSLFRNNKTFAILFLINSTPYTGYSTIEIKNILSFSERLINGRIKELIDYGFIKTIKKGRTPYYYSEVNEVTAAFRDFMRIIRKHRLKSLRVNLQKWILRIWIYVNVCDRFS